MTDIAPIHYDAIPAPEDAHEIPLEVILQARLAWEADMDVLLGELADMASRANDKDADTISRAMAVIEVATNE